MKNMIYSPIFITIFILSITTHITKGFFELKLKVLRNVLPEPFNFRGTIRQKLAMEVLGQFPYDDTLCSLLPIIQVLSKISNSSTQSTQSEIIAALGYNERQTVGILIDIWDVNARNPKNEYTGSDTDSYFGYVSFIFVSDEYNLKETFESHIFHIYYDSVKMYSPSSFDYINGLMASSTMDDSSSNLLQAYNLTDNTKVLLLCALNLKTYWNHSFTETYLDKFNSNQNQVDLTMMRKTETLRYTNNNALNAEIIEMPLQDNDSYILFLLPKSDLTDLIKTIKAQPELLNVVLDSMNVVNVEVNIPRFKIKTVIDLKGPLEKIGLKNLFSGEGLTDLVIEEAVHVSKFLQMTELDVNENGMSTYKSGYKIASTKQETPKISSAKFIANKPFLFYIKIKGEQVFVGIYNAAKDVGDGDPEVDDYDGPSFINSFFGREKGGRHADNMHIENKEKSNSDEEENYSV